MAHRASWQEYQKDIAPDKYYYARSCIRQNFFPGSERAFLNILQRIDTTMRVVAYARTSSLAVSEHF